MGGIKYCCWPPTPRESPPDIVMGWFNLMDVAQHVEVLRKHGCSFLVDVVAWWR